MKFAASHNAHILILPACWVLTAACWSFPIWKYSHGPYTFGGGLVFDLSWNLLGITPYILGFVASVLEVTAIALGLSFLRVPVWIYGVTPIVPAYELVTFHGSSFDEYLREFGLYGAWSFYFTAALALLAFALLYVVRRVRHKTA